LPALQVRTPASLPPALATDVVELFVQIVLADLTRHPMPTPALAAKPVRRRGGRERAVPRVVGG
jgi:hypothetical protein